MKREIEAYFFLIQYNIVKSNHPPIPSHSRVSRIHQLLSPNPLPLFNSSSPATAQKPLPPLWSRSKCWMWARGANIQRAATKITNMPYWGQWLLCCGWRRWIKQEEGIWGTEADVFCLLGNDGEQRVWFNLQYSESKQKTSTLSPKSPQLLFNSNKI